MLSLSVINGSTFPYGELRIDNGSGDVGMHYGRVRDAKKRAADIIELAKIGGIMGFKNLREASSTQPKYDRTKTKNPATTSPLGLRSGLYEAYNKPFNWGFVTARRLPLNAKKAPRRNAEGLCLLDRSAAKVYPADMRRVIPLHARRHDMRIAPLFERALAAEVEDPRRAIVDAVIVNLKRPCVYHGYSHASSLSDCCKARAVDAPR